MATAIKINNYSEISVDITARIGNNNFIMSEIRKSILKEMEKYDLTIYQVAKLVDGKVPQRTVYGFLTAEKDTSTRTASIILDALGITLTPKQKKVKDV